MRRCWLAWVFTFSLALAACVPEPAPVVTQTALATPTEGLPFNPNLTHTGCDDFQPQLPAAQAAALSQADLARVLFSAYLAHYQNPALDGSMCELINFSVDDVIFDERLAFLAQEQGVDYVVSLLYSIQIDEVPSSWVAANGEFAPDGWIIKKSLIVGVTIRADQAFLTLIGTGP